MLTIRHFNDKANTTKWIAPNGRLITLQFSARRDAVPVWLIERLRTYAARFDWGDDCTDPWDILRRINNQVVWRGAWGTATLASGIECFVSEEIAWPQHADVDAAADDLDIPYAFAPGGGRFAFAERAGVWR